MSSIVVFASGRGSNLDAILQAIEKKTLHTQVLAVISDQPQAQALAKAQAAGIQALCVPIPDSQGGKKSILQRRHEHEEKILRELNKLNPNFLVLAGYMRILTSHLIDTYRCDRGYVRMVNIHPSLLPAFPGVHSYAQAYRYGAKVSGVTVHLVEPEVDSGPICAQESFSIVDCKTELEVEQRGLEIEHRLYPETLNWILAEKFEVEHRSEGRICVRQN